MNMMGRTLRLFLITAWCVSGVSAATFVVNSSADTADANPGNGACADSSGFCSFRAAISEANALPGADIITLGAATYTQSLIASNDNSNNGGDWDINSQITINGADQQSTILQASTTPNSAPNERVLHVLSGGGNLTLRNVTVRYGHIEGEGLITGGGVANFGTLSLDGVIVRDNAITSIGNAIGGGIYNGGPALTINNSTVTANSVFGNAPGAGFGGGIGVSTSNLSTLTITGSSVSGNAVRSVGTPGSGGGLYLGSFFDFIAVNSHFDNNTVTANLGTEGGGALLVSITGASTFNVNGCTFNGNSLISGMNFAIGAGLHIYTSSSGATQTGTLDKVTIANNLAQGPGNSRGGGLFVNPVGAAINLNVTNSTISQNSNDFDGGGVGLNGTAGGSTVNFTNTTISGNTTGNENSGLGGNGGGVHVEMSSGSTTVNFNFVTIKDNIALSGGGGIYNAGNATINLKNTVVAGNSAGILGPDIAGVLMSQNYNHIEDLGGATFTPAANDISGFDPQLGLLQNNGGPTLTHSPLAGSPVVDRIPTGQAGCGTNVFNDQRGFGRPFGSGCDKGSVERGASLAAGPWTLSGVVRTTAGIPVRNAVVRISGGNLPSPRMVVTGNFGSYQFGGLSGNEYTVSVAVKRFHLNDPVQIFAVGSNITNADFVANASSGRVSLTWNRF